MKLIARRLATAGVTLVGIALLAACGSTDVTQARVEHSVAPTFANLYVQQAAILGHTGVTVASVSQSTTIVVIAKSITYHMQYYDK